MMFLKKPQVQCQNPDHCSEAFEAYNEEMDEDDDIEYAEELTEDEDLTEYSTTTENDTDDEGEMTNLISNKDVCETISDTEKPTNGKLLILASYFKKVKKSVILRLKTKVAVVLPKRNRSQLFRKQSRAFLKIRKSRFLRCLTLSDMAIM